MSEKERKQKLAERFGRAAVIAASLTEEKVRDIQVVRGNLSGVFEKEDPSSDYDNMPFDAFDRVLMCLGVTPRSVAEYGVQATTLQEMNENEKARFLIGETFGRAWRKAVHGETRANTSLNTSQDIALGSFLNQYAFPASIRTPALQAAIPLSEVIAITTGIDKTYYRPFYMEDVPQTDDIMARVSEGAEVPAVKITSGEKQITLKKTGRRIDVTYEALRQIPIDLMGYYIQRIAIKSEADKVNRVIDVALNGDGNPNTAATNFDLTTLDPSATAGNPTLKAYLSYKMEFDNPFALTHLFGRKDSLLKLMLLNTGTANTALTQAGGAFAQQFQLIGQGVNDIVKIGRLNALPAGVLLGLDKRVALERIYEIGGTIREVDKWIREQKESLVMTEMEAYAVNEPKAIKTFNMNA